MNHIIENRQHKQALIRGDFVQPRALEEGKQEMGVDGSLARELARGEWADEKQKTRIEDLGRDFGTDARVGAGVDRVERESVGLPTYGEALKN